MTDSENLYKTAMALTLGIELLWVVVVSANGEIALTLSQNFN